MHKEQHRVIYKYPLETEFGAQSVRLPKDSDALSVLVQRGVLNLDAIVLYAVVDPNETETEVWWVNIYPTGEEFGQLQLDLAGLYRIPWKKFLGTVTIGRLVFHVFAYEVRLG